MEPLSNEQILITFQNISKNGFTDDLVKMFIEVIQFSQKGEMDFITFIFRWEWKGDEWSHSRFVEFSK